MAAQLRNVFAMGLKLPINTDPEGKILPNEMAKAKEQNLNLDVFSIDPSKPVDDIMAELNMHLDSKKYAAIAVGFGLRGDRNLTPLFEKVVNVSVEKQPEAKLSFPTLPTVIVESFQRVL